MENILIVENDPLLREGLEEAIQSDSRKIAKADSEATALKQLNKKEFDLVITDLRMESENSGVELLKKIKSKNVFTQVILVTAYGNREIGVEAMKLGAFDYIERNAPGTSFYEMLPFKTTLALKFREALLRANL